MTKRDYYEILGVDRSASNNEIKSAFRRLAHQYHPDKHRGDKKTEEKFKEINGAYEILKDPKKRAQYDRFGFAGMPGTGGMGDYGFDFQDIFGDVFRDFFGTTRGRARGQRGADLAYEMEITFDESAFGTEKKIKIPKLVICENCHGSGARPGTTPTMCSTCNGSGQVMYQQGFFSISRSCSSCRGEGRIINDPCTECSGNGRARVSKSVAVNVPAGVETGTRLRLSGEGESGVNGGPPGDLYIIIGVKSHPIFQRQNDDIICEVPISFPQAALGTEMDVPTLEGKVKLKVPAGTQSGKVFRMKGKGIASLHTMGRGDQKVVVRVETPAKLTKRQRELFEEFARISGDDTTPLRKGFFDKVKEIFE
ncbi:MAG: molecular chaperone DnaJ [Thermodesulfobacteriota bacterium]